MDTDTLLGWAWTHVKGSYWEEEVEFIGKVPEVKRKDTGRELVMKGTGTPTESLLKALTGIPSRQLRVHLCDDPCTANYARPTERRLGGAKTWRLRGRWTRTTS